ncbi:unnamed protein product [Cuscuta campestris]|uniref:NAC domain-containing protein n=1 Tax=Cuscuta campestris TaxID=132261 RepID=A0A484KA16_9ASTE|nr:unnamed protein product [Cuscuta campestris]
MEVGAYQNPNLPGDVFEAPPPPVGYRFRPTDSELLDHYLRRLIHKLPLPTLYPRITRLDIYADHPSAIWNLEDAHDDTGSGAELHCYFYTALQCVGKGLRAKKMGRTVGAHGTWHMSCTRETKVNNNNADQVLGYNKYFNYKPNTVHPGDVEYEWGMHEFTLHDSNKYALCKITRRMRKKKLKGAVDESVMLSNQQQQGDHIGFGEIVLSSNHGDPAKQPNLELSPESITCSFNKVSDHDEVGSSSPTTFTSVPLSHQQPLLEHMHQAHTAALLEPLSQFENSDFNDVVLCETQGGHHPQQPHMDHSHGSIVTTSSDCFELEDFDDIFLDLGDSVEVDDVREEAYYQPTVGSIGSQLNTTCKRARVEKGTRCIEHDQHIHEVGSSPSTTFTSVPLSHQQQLLENTNQAHTAALLEPLSQFENSDFNDVLCETQLLENTNQAHTAALLEPLSQFENSDFNDVVLCETEGGHPQQPHMDHSHGSIVTTSSDSFELEDFKEIFLDLGDFVELDDVREEAYYQPTVGSIGSQQNTTCKRARVEEGTGCVQYDQHMHDAGANGAKRFRYC